QRDRRNLTDAEVMSLVPAVDKRKPKGQRTDLAHVRLGPASPAPRPHRLWGLPRTRLRRSGRSRSTPRRPTTTAISTRAASRWQEPQVRLLANPAWRRLPGWGSVKPASSVISP